jgi:hypothetical protein
LTSQKAKVRFCTAMVARGMAKPKPSRLSKKSLTEVEKWEFPKKNEVSGCSVWLCGPGQQALRKK